MGILRRYFFAGLLVWLPLWVTFSVLRFLIRLMDRTVLLLPAPYQPDHLLGFHLPGLGLLISVVVLLVTGLLVTNFLGRHLVLLWERVLSHIPIARTIYMAVKQVLETVFSSSGQSFRQVLMIEYPRRGLWSMAFQTGQGAPQCAQHTDEDLITVFIPTTPNPTSGFLMMIDRKDAICLDMSVEDALKWIISLGVVNTPMPRDNATPVLHR